MSRAVLFSLPIVSGLLGVLSLPSYDLGFLAWVGLAPLLFSLRQRGLLAGAGLGLLFGLSFAAGGFYWLNAIPNVTPLRFGMLVTAFSVYYVAFGSLYAATNRLIGSWMILGGPALWVSFEYARASLSFLALPWNFVGHSQYRYLPLIQIADLTGVYGVSFVLLATNQFLSQLPDLVAGRKWRWQAQGFALACVLAAMSLYGWHRLAVRSEGQDHLRVALVQANVTTRANMSVKDQMAHLVAYERLTNAAAKEKPDLIVWPSSSLPAPINLWIIRLFVNDVAHRAGAHLLVGGAGGDKFAPPRDGYLPYSNSEFLVAPSGRLEAQYNKLHLTPFTESVPLHGLVHWPRWITTLQNSFRTGEGYTLFQVSHARFGAPICWENAFADLFRRFVLNGANVMVSVTNEGAFGPGSGPQQTLAMNVFRAVENRVAIARAATTGVSAFIDAHGKIVARVQDAAGKDVFVSGILVRDLSLSSRRTFYTLYGDVFAQTVAGTTLLMLACCVFMAIRGRAGSRQRETLDGSAEPLSP